MKKQDIPNLITLLRILLVIPVLLALQADRYGWAFILFLAGGISDGVDGCLARKYGWHSRLGSMLDPLADKLLMVSTFLCLAYLGNIPMWLVTVVIIRDVVIILGGVSYHFLIGAYDFQPSLLSKFNTFLQLLLIILILFQNNYAIFPQIFLTIIMYMIFVTNVTSLIHYVSIWSVRAIRLEHKDS